MARSEFVQSVLRGLDILERVARSEEGLTLQQLSDQMGLQTSTVHNLARTLVARGYLAKTTRPVRYRLGSALPELMDMQSRRRLLQRAGETMLEMARDMPEATVTLAEDAGGEIVASLRLSPDRPGILQHNNRVMNPYLTSSSLVFLAFWSDNARTAYMQRYPLWEFGAPLWKDAAQLEESIISIRSQGYASRHVARGDATVFNMAVPLFDSRNNFIAVLGMSLAVAGDAAGSPCEQLALDLVLAAASQIGLGI